LRDVHWHDPLADKHPYFQICNRSESLLELDYGVKGRHEMRLLNLCIGLVDERDALLGVVKQLHRFLDVLQDLPLESQLI